MDTNNEDINQIQKLATNHSFKIEMELDGEWIGSSNAKIFVELSSN